MKSILTFVALLGLTTATGAFGVQQTTPAPGGGDQRTTQKRDRMRTPGSEPSGAPKQDQMRKHDRIHTPGTAQPGTPRGGQQPGSGSPRQGGGRGR